MTSRPCAICGGELEPGDGQNCGPCRKGVSRLRRNHRGQDIGEAIHVEIVTLRRLYAARDGTEGMVKLLGLMPVTGG